MDIVEAIINFYETQEQAADLRILVEGSGDVATDGKMVADYDPEQSILPPYITVEEKISPEQPENIGRKFRLDRVDIQFGVFAARRSDVTAILDELESMLEVATFSTSPRAVMGFPYLVSRQTFWGLDHYCGLLSIYYLTEKQLGNN